VRSLVKNTSIDSDYLSEVEESDATDSDEEDVESARMNTEEMELILKNTG